MMKKKSIYKYAAEAGLPTGLYLCLMSACFLISIRVSFISMLIFPLMLMFPFYLGFVLLRIGKLEPKYMKFSTLWLGGIYTVIFGTLICMLFSTIYMMYIEPGFMSSYFANVIDVLETSPYSGQLGMTLENLYRMRDSHLLPSAMDFVITMGWWTSFSGSILSLVIALILSRRSKRLTTPVS